MSYYRQQNRHRLSIGQEGNALTMLIAINLIVFVILAFIKVVYFFSEPDHPQQVFFTNFFDWLTLPADFNKFLTRPWTIISHMFVHDMGANWIWHILGNMIWLWVFGYILQDLTGNSKIFPVFLYGAFAGALAYMIAFNVVPPLRVYLHDARAYGASAGVMAIAVATTTLAPNYRIFNMIHGGIPIWIVTAVYLVLDLALIPDNNPGGHIAHLAGGAMGFAFMALSQRGHDIGSWMINLYEWANNLFNPDKPQKNRTAKHQLFYKAGVQPFKKTPTLTQQKVDEILEKIHQKGYNALTEDEREVLRRASQEEL
jgi:membrane associated rhomboid family serine protease